jgi:hypothetical protein
LRLTTDQKPGILLPISRNLPAILPEKDSLSFDIINVS